jgi:hypothetical protein
MAVVPDDASPSGTELSRVTVVALLSRLLGDDADLHERVAAGEFAELIWEGDRISTSGTSIPAIAECAQSRCPSGQLRDPSGGWLPGRGRDGGERPADLAHATGGRFMVEEDDLTDRTVGDALDLISGPAVSGEPASGGAEPASGGESDGEYLRRYLAAGDARAAWLRQQYESGVVTGADGLDYSRESLVPLWAWAIGRFQLRDDDAPMDLVVTENRGRYFVPRGAVLSMWYGRSALLAPHAWSDDSLTQVDAIAWYVAECLLRLCVACGGRSSTPRSGAVRGPADACRARRSRRAYQGGVGTRRPGVSRPPPERAQPVQGDAGSTVQCGSAGLVRRHRQSVSGLALTGLGSLHRPHQRPRRSRSLGRRADDSSG